jgi:2-alkenal reductase
VVVALVVGFLAGLGGGVLGARVGRAPAAASAPAPDLQAQIRAATDRVLPNTVLVIAELQNSQNFGSGVVVSQGGHILTASHVVRGATSISVYLSNGEARQAKLLSDDAPFTDIAVLQVQPQGLRQIAFGSSAALKPGDFVLSLSGGTGQFGPGNQVAMGVVSQTNRTLARSGVTFEDLVQTDAAINSGDSGGPLVNLAGELIGITTTVIREGPDAEQVRDVGFAQSSDSLRPLVAAVIANGKYPRARIGIEFPQQQTLEIDPQLAGERKLPVQQGALVVAPAPNSPAARAGIAPGDIVVGVNGQPVTYDVPMVNLLKRLPKGVRVDLAVLRGTQRLTVQITPED